MANFEALKDDALEGAVGGAGKEKVIGQSENPNAAHWQPKDHRPGDEWVWNNHTWYMIKPGDTLYNIAVHFNTTVSKIQAMNPMTIKNPQLIYANDAIVVL